MRRTTKQPLKSFLALLIFLTVLPIFAQAKEPWEISSFPYFYEISYEGNKSYILGTRHFGVSLNDLNKIVKDRLESSNKVFMEVALSKGETQLFFQHPFKLSNIIRSKLEVSLIKYSTPKKTTLDKLIQLGIPAELTNVISNGDCRLASYTRFKTDANKIKAMDFEVIKIAHDQHIEVIGLDDLDYLKSAFDTANTCSLDDELDGVNPIDQINSEDEGIYIYMSAQIFFSETLDRNSDVSDRNHTWTRTLTKNLKTGNTFVAVGAAHLLGPNSILDSLRRNGFSITKIED